MTHFRLPLESLQLVASFVDPTWRSRYLPIIWSCKAFMEIFIETCVNTRNGHFSSTGLMFVKFVRDRFCPARLAAFQCINWPIVWLEDIVLSLNRITGQHIAQLLLTDWQKFSDCPSLAEHLAACLLSEKSLGFVIINFDFKVEKTRRFLELVSGGLVLLFV